MVPVDAQYKIGSHDRLGLGTDGDALRFLRHHAWGITCTSGRAARPIIYFTRRENGRYVQMGQVADDLEHTLHIAVGECAVCLETTCSFLLCHTIPHYLCDECMVRTAATTERRCPVCRTAFVVPKRKLKSYAVLLEKERERLRKEITDLVAYTDVLRDEVRAASHMRIVLWHTQVRRRQLTNILSIVCLALGALFLFQANMHKVVDLK